MTREALTSEGAIERFADAIVDGFARATEVELHAIPVRPMIQRRRGELRAVIALDDGREALAMLAGFA